MFTLSKTNNTRQSTTTNIHHCWVGKNKYMKVMLGLALIQIEAVLDIKDP